ncbi:SDR family oxidoreductase [Fulvivirga sediminis]|uniref:SDR family oxidoreductase n=1 Tax=Fulvivirga sediminis TaxID=2803949 RepID=A0A937K0B4_9BACT|nr:SDR family oxidoreductase [Fulvivirga sediminis]MBL3658193.1 SDR family oxidoreductase [Fulvivirga sediminis]
MQTVLILGGTSDIAYELAKTHIAKQDEVILASRNIANLEVIQSDLKIRYEGEVQVVKFDATDTSSHRSFFSGLPDSISVVYCLFGYLGDNDLAKTSWAEAQQIINSNYVGAVSILNIIAENFAKKREGVIVGVSSVAGVRGRQSNYMYGSAKAGFTAYLSGLRNSLYKDGVHVLTVLPGFMDTKMTAGMNLPKLLTASPENAAQKIAKAAQKKRNIVYVLGKWRYIMMIISSIPEPIFKKLKL